MINPALLEKAQAIRSKKHLAFVRTLPCSITKDGEHCNLTPVVAHHLTIIKGARGMGQKAGDNYTLPLCHFHHMALHHLGEKKWWMSWGVCAKELALNIASQSPDEKIREYENS